MAKILVLAKSGFGKTTSIGKVEAIGNKGLEPKDTYLISSTSKPLPFPKSKVLYPLTNLQYLDTRGTVDVKSLSSGKRVVSNVPGTVTAVLQALVNSPFKNIVLDDFNYLMQDWYMDNALATGWDGPKKIGYFIGQIFKAIETLDVAGKNIFVLAHGEEEKSEGDQRVYVKMKTTGKMVDSYVTPEGKFDVVLLGVSSFNSSEKRVCKNFLTNENEFYSSAKSPIGMFDKEFIPNDLGIVVDKLKEYYGE